MQHQLAFLHKPKLRKVLEMKNPLQLYKLKNQMQDLIHYYTQTLHTASKETSVITFNIFKNTRKKSLNDKETTTPIS